MERDYTKYTVEGLGENLNKRQLVFTVVKDYVEKNNPSFDELQNTFTNEIQGSKGFIRKESDVKTHKHFNMREPIKIKNGVHIVVSNQWGSKNIHDLLILLEKLGYNVSVNSVENKTNTITEKVKESPQEPQTLKKININISGNITNYMFGILGNEAYAECEKAITYAIDDDVETIGEFVKMFYETTLEGGDGMEIFLESFDMERFKSNCPLLSEFLNKVEEGDAGHLQFYEEVLDMNLRDEVNFIEDDASITITVDGEEIISQTKLVDFLGKIEVFVEENDDPIAVAIVKEFWSKNGAKFNMEDRDEYTINKAENGVLLLPEWIEPVGLTPYNTRERNITAEHDNIVSFDFYFNAPEFDLAKLAFMGFANTDFHHSFPDYVGSYLVYDNKIIRPDQNIHRDKGFTLHYEDNSKSCNYLIEG